MTIPTITVTKIDHDNWWGYYINDELYGYNDYYNFSDQEVKKEAILRAIDNGLIANRQSPFELKFEHHTSWDFMTRELLDLAEEEFDNELPNTLTEFKNWFLDKAKELVN